MTRIVRDEREDKFFLHLAGRQPIVLHKVPLATGEKSVVAMSACIGLGGNACPQCGRVGLQKTVVEYGERDGWVRFCPGCGLAVARFGLLDGDPPVVFSSTPEEVKWEVSIDQVTTAPATTGFYTNKGRWICVLHAATAEQLGRLTYKAFSSVLAPVLADGFPTNEVIHKLAKQLNWRWPVAMREDLPMPNNIHVGGFEFVGHSYKVIWGTASNFAVAKLSEPTRLSTIKISLGSWVNSFKLSGVEERAFTALMQSMAVRQTLNRTTDWLVAAQRQAGVFSDWTTDTNGSVNIGKVLGEFLAPKLQGRFRV